MSVNVTSAETPNPNSRRFIVDVSVQEESRGRFFTDPSEADESDASLARRLLEISGVAGVMLLPTSVTVNKTDDSSWDDVEPAAQAVIEEVLG